MHLKVFLQADSFQGDLHHEEVLAAGFDPAWAFVCKRVHFPDGMEPPEWLCQAARFAEGEPEGTTMVVDLQRAAELGRQPIVRSLDGEFGWETRGHSVTLSGTRSRCTPPENIMAAIDDLEEKLLSLGGQTFPRPEGFFDPDLDLILLAGQVWKPRRIRRIEGVPHRCHANAILHFLWDQHFGSGSKQIVTGYAVTGGLWHQHSWLWDGRHVWEGTGRRDLYFGAILQGDYLTRFVLSGLMDNGLVPEFSFLSKDAS